MTRTLSRREVLKLMGLGTIGAYVAACAPGAGESAGDAASTAAKKEAAPAEAAKPAKDQQQEVTIFFWDGPPLIGIREEALKGFSEAYPGCKMNFTSSPGGWSGGYSDKLFTMLAAGQPPDVFIIQIADLPSFLHKDLLLDLKPYIDRDQYDLSEFPELAIKTYTYNGGIYGLPDNVCSYATFYNKDMFEQAGVSAPTPRWDDPAWTVDDFLAACEKLTVVNAEGKTEQYAYNIPTTYRLWGAWVRIFGGRLVDDPFNPTECMLHEPEAVAALQFLQDLRWKYGFAPRPEALAEIGATELLLTGRLAMMEDGSWFFNQVRGADFTFDVGHMPTGPGGRSNYVFYFPLVIPKATKSPECAWNLLKYYEGPAIEEIIKAGGLQGTRLSAQRKWFVTDPQPPEHKEVFVDAVEHFVAPDPMVTNWREIENMLNAEMDLLWLGQRDAQATALAIKEKMDALIEAGQWRTDLSAS